MMEEEEPGMSRHERARQIKLHTRASYTMLSKAACDNPNSDLFYKTMDQAHLASQYICDPQEGVQDSNILRQAAVDTLRRARKISSDKDSDPSTVFNKLVSTHGHLGKLDFKTLGQHVCGLYPRIPRHFFMAGPLEKPPRKKAAQRSRRRPDAPAVALAQALEEEGEGNRDYTAKQTSIMRRKARKGLSFVKDVVDKNSFSQTVENVFHLVHNVAENRRNMDERRMVLQPSEDGSDVVMKVVNPEDCNEEDSVTQQFILQMDLAGYQKLVQRVEEEGRRGGARAR